MAAVNLELQVFPAAQHIGSDSRDTDFIRLLSARPGS